MPPSIYIPQEMLACLKRYWGYTRFRPWQEETILAILDDQESLTILPTGGGKSLCFQLPALLKEGMAVVISPLSNASAVISVRFFILLRQLLHEEIIIQFSNNLLEN
jgi:superfamily II DNA/RNA helicase